MTGPSEFFPYCSPGRGYSAPQPLQCKCGCAKLDVKDSRPVSVNAVTPATYRMRKCRDCGTRFRTIEVRQDWIEQVMRQNCRTEAGRNELIGHLEYLLSELK